MDPKTQQPEQQEGVQPQAWKYNAKVVSEYSEHAKEILSPSNEKPEKSDVLAEWSASEFVDHNKEKSWYVMLAVAAAILAGVLYIITKEVMSVVVVLFMSATLGYYGAVKPKVIKYVVKPEGINIGNNSHSFSEIKSFCIIKEATIPHLQLLLRKKISVPLTIYVAPDFLDQITDIIGEHVPYDQKKQDHVDRLSAHFRF